MLTYRHGLVLPHTVKCHRCGARFTGRVVQEGPRWAIHLRCGHVKTAGWTMPPEELKKRGLVQTEPPKDPRAEWIKKQEEEDRKREAHEIMEHLKRRGHMTRDLYL